MGDDAIAAALCVPVAFVLRCAPSRTQAALLLEVCVLSCVTPRTRSPTRA